MATQIRLAYIIFLCLCLSGIEAGAQIFRNATGIDLKERGAVSYPIEVSGLRDKIDTINFGIEAVTFDIEHPDTRKLTLFLESPDGTKILLLKKLPGRDYANTTLDGSAQLYIDFGQSPYRFNYRPIEDLGVLNNFGNPNGIWRLIVLDDSTGGTGMIKGASLSFGNKPAKPILSSSDLPIVIINTHGQEIGNTEKLLADMKVIYNGLGKRNFIHQKDFHYQGKIAIKIRGNSSQRYPKKQYGFDTMNQDGSEDEKVSLLGMPKESDWILSAIYQDKTLMRNPLTYRLANEMGGYASRTQYCELLINNEYRGVFVFQEKINRDKNRVDVEKLTAEDENEPDVSGGYIFKLDNVDPDESYWKTKISNPKGLPWSFVYVYPKKQKDLKPKQKQYIEGFVDRFEQSLLQDDFADPLKGYRQYVDEASFIDYFLLNEVSNNIDAYRKSAYFHKKRNGKIMAGPVWDYDLAWGNANYFGGNSPQGYRYSYTYPADDYQVPFWWMRMMEDSVWRNNMACRYRELRKNILSIDYLYGIVDSLYSSINPAQERNFIRWNILGQYVSANPSPIPPDYAAEVANLKSIIKARLQFLDADLPQCMDEALMPSQNVENLVPGVAYSYYEDSDYSVVPDFLKTNPISKGISENFDINIAKRKERFALHFEAYIDISSDGIYTFYTSSDDGSILYINGRKVVDNDGLHSLKEASGRVGLRKGKHKISIGYFQRDRDRTLAVQFAGPGTSKQAIPNDKLFRQNNLELLPSVNPAFVVPGLDYKYYEFDQMENKSDLSKLSPRATGTAKDFNPSVALRSNKTAVRFEGFIHIPADGIYTFYSKSHGDNSVTIDGRLVIDNLGLLSNEEIAGNIGLRAGKHLIAVDYFHVSGEQSLSISYSGSGMMKTPIPASSLFREQTEGLLAASEMVDFESGLIYEYYEAPSYDRLPNFSASEASKEGVTQDFDLSVASRSNFYALQFNGFIDIPVDGYYTFYTSSDDGSSLYIHEKNIVNNDGLHSLVQRHGTIGLKKGKHPLRVEFFQASGGKSLEISYSSASFDKKPIAASALYHKKEKVLLPPVTTGPLQNGLTYKYFEAPEYQYLPEFANQSPLKIGVVPSFDISVALRTSSFAIQFEGYIDVPNDGYYTFYTSSDDGSVLLIDDKYVVENNGLHAMRERSGTIGLKAGKHRISVGYFQEGGGKSLNVYVSGPGMGKQIVPPSLLYRDLQHESPMQELKGKLDTGGLLTSGDGLENLQVHVYPNPFLHLLNVELKGNSGKYEIDFTDIFGRILFAKTGVSTSAFHLETFDMSNIQKGQYFIRIRHNEKVYTLKVEKK